MKTIKLEKAAWISDDRRNEKKISLAVIRCFA